jgi:energy-coupling factor transport system ATP-binding protein
VTPHDAIRWNRVTFAFPDGPPALIDIDCVVADGEIVVVVGGSGSGKSTLLRSVNGLVPHASGGRFRGSVAVGPLAHAGKRPRDLADVVGFVQKRRSSSMRSSTTSPSRWRTSACPKR